MNHPRFEGTVGEDRGEEGTLRYLADIGIIVSTFEFRNGEGVEPLLSLKLSLRKNPAGCNGGGRNDDGLDVVAFVYDAVKLLFR